MFAKVLSASVMPVICIILAVFFWNSVKTVAALPTIYQSSITEECVRATDSHGKKLSCAQAKKGKYHIVWI